MAPTGGRLSSRLLDGDNKRKYYDDYYESLSFPEDAESTVVTGARSGLRRNDARWHPPHARRVQLITNNANRQLPNHVAAWGLGTVVYKSNTEYNIPYVYSIDPDAITTDANFLANGNTKFDLIWVFDDQYGQAEHVIATQQDPVTILNTPVNAMVTLAGLRGDSSSDRVRLYKVVLRGSSNLITFSQSPGEPYSMYLPYPGLAWPLPVPTYDVNKIFAKQTDATVAGMPGAVNTGSTYTVYLEMDITTAPVFTEGVIDIRTCETLTTNDPTTFDGVYFNTLSTHTNMYYARRLRVRVTSGLGFEAVGNWTEYYCYPPDIAPKHFKVTMPFDQMRIWSHELVLENCGTGENVVTGLDSGESFTLWCQHERRKNTGAQYMPLQEEHGNPTTSNGPYDVAANALLNVTKNSTNLTFPTFVHKTQPAPGVPAGPLERFTKYTFHIVPSNWSQLVPKIESSGFRPEWKSIQSDLNHPHNSYWDEYPVVTSVDPKPKVSTYVLGGTELVGFRVTPGTVATTLDTYGSYTTRECRVQRLELKPSGGTIDLPATDGVYSYAAYPWSTGPRLTQYTESTTDADVRARPPYRHHMLYSSIKFNDGLYWEYNYPPETAGDTENPFFYTVPGFVSWTFDAEPASLQNDALRIHLTGLDAFTNFLDPADKYTVTLTIRSADDLTTLHTTDAIDLSSPGSLTFPYLVFTIDRTTHSAWVSATSAQTFTIYATLHYVRDLDSQNPMIVFEGNTPVLTPTLPDTQPLPLELYDMSALRGTRLMQELNGVTLTTEQQAAIQNAGQYYRHDGNGGANIFQTNISNSDTVATNTHWVHSVSLWFRVNAVPASKAAAFSIGNGDNGAGGTDYFARMSALEVRPHSSSPTTAFGIRYVHYANDTVPDNFPALDLGKWYFMVYTTDASKYGNMYLYTPEGNKYAYTRPNDASQQTPLADVRIAGNNILMFGTAHYGLPQYFTGDIGRFDVYENTVLTSAEADVLYDTHKDIFRPAYTLGTSTDPYDDLSFAGSLTNSANPTPYANATIFDALGNDITSELQPSNYLNDSGSLPIALQLETSKYLSVYLPVEFPSWTTFTIVIHAQISDTPFVPLFSTTGDGIDSTEFSGFEMYVQDGNLYINGYKSTSSAPSTVLLGGGSPIGIAGYFNRFHQFAMTYDFTGGTHTLKSYFDGTLLQTYTDATSSSIGWHTLPPSSRALLHKRGNQLAAANMPTAIKRYGAYNYALTGAELLSMYLAYDDLIDLGQRKLMLRCDAQDYDCYAVATGNVIAGLYEVSGKYRTGPQAAWQIGGIGSHSARAVPDGQDMLLEDFTGSGGKKAFRGLAVFGQMEYTPADSFAKGHIYKYGYDVASPNPGFGANIAYNSFTVILVSELVTSEGWISWAPLFCYRRSNMARHIFAGSVNGSLAGFGHGVGTSGNANGQVTGYGFINLQPHIITLRTQCTVSPNPGPATYITNIKVVRISDGVVLANHTETDNASTVSDLFNSDGNFFAVGTDEITLNTPNIRWGEVLMYNEYFDDVLLDTSINILRTKWSA